MQSLQNKAVEYNTKAEEYKQKLIREIQFIAALQSIHVVVLTPDYKPEDMLKILIQLQAPSHRKPFYLSISTIGEKFFSSTQVNELLLFIDLFKKLGGIYVEGLESLISSLNNTVSGESNA